MAKTFVRLMLLLVMYSGSQMGTVIMAEGGPCEENDNACYEWNGSHCEPGSCSQCGPAWCCACGG